MTLSKNKRIFNDFSKGLITEAHSLNFPENASIDELNMDAHSSGYRMRRKGFDYEDGYSLSSFSFNVSDIGDSKAMSTHRWESAGGDPDVNFVVQQIGNTLYFYDASSDPLSDGRESFTVDISTYASSTNPGQLPVFTASGLGALFVVNERLDPFYIAYNSSSNTVSTSAMNVKIRDFDGVDDTLDIDEMPASLSAEHEYNLKNQGWKHPDTDRDEDTYIDYFFGQKDLYPSNSQTWLPGKKDDSDTSLTMRDILLTGWGTTPAPKGHFILDAFEKDRSTVSGVSGLDIVEIVKRPSAVAFFAGRVWLGGSDGTLYFSQALNEDLSNVGNCYQAADPTAEEMNALVDTDGGVIKTPELAGIVSLVPVGSSLVVIAKNGIKQLSGGTSGFAATDYAVKSVSGTQGAKNGRGVVVAESLPIWLTDSGIYTLKVDSVSEQMSVASLSEGTIQSFLDELSQTSVQNAYGVYDRFAKRVIWMYSSDNDTDNEYVYDSFLILDLSKGAFYPWKVAPTLFDEPVICGAVETNLIGNVTEEEVVTDGGVTVTDSAVAVTVDSIISSATGAGSLRFAVIKPNGSSSKLTFGHFRDNTFVDFASYDGSGESFSSYFLTGYNLQEDPSTFKQAPALHCFFRRTETGYTGSEQGGYSLVNPSSCLMQGRWEWADHSNSNKWSTEQQVYRMRRPYMPNSELDFDNGFPVVVSRTPIRGRGRALALKFTSEEGKDFQILGWSLITFSIEKE